MADFLKKISYLLLFLSSLVAILNCSDQNVNLQGKKSYTFFNDFETECENFIWKNVVRNQDSSAFSGDFVCECPENMLYAFGFDLSMRDSIQNQNALLSFDMMVKAKKSPNVIFALSLQKGNDVLMWKAFPMSKGFVAENQWYNNTFEMLIPNDMLKNTSLNCYVMNNNKEILFIDDFKLCVEYQEVPTYIDDVEKIVTAGDLSQISKYNTLNLLYSDNDNKVAFADNNLQKITDPISMFYSLIIDGDTTKLQLFDWKLTEENETYMLKNINDIVTTSLNISYENNDPNVNFSLQSTYHKDVNVLRSSLIIPFLNDNFKIYRNNYFIDTTDYQDVYYLDNEGFSLELTEKQLNLYHLNEISSVQLDARNAIAYINADFHLDHRLIRFPFSDTSDYYVDNSSAFMKKGNDFTSSFSISLANKKDLPRIMPINYGYESAFIWTEHADWTDIKTHRATYFGSEDVENIENAVGGFAYYDIPVTKSVFYHNPDSVINFEKNKNFPGLHSTIKTDDSYLDFLKQLNNNGFDICLHTPEQYTSDSVSLKEAMSFMKDNFSSSSWIDHGYNNGILSNRENMICDGLDSNSVYYVYDLWKDNGVKYIWNASLEDQRPYDKYLYDNNLLRPYPGFGDAFPLPKIARHPSYPDIYMWFTPCTIEPGENWAWDYYFSQERLDKIVDFRYVFITHIYAPWVEEFRGFWEMKNGKIVAKDGFNQALERIAKMKEQRLLFPTTIDNYMTYQEQLLKLGYKVDENGNVLLKNNNNETIKGLSLISTKEMSLENDKSFNIRKTKSGDEYIIWFDMEPNEELTINN